MKLEELQLQIGKQMEVAIIGLDYKRHELGAVLLGYERNITMMVSLPNKPPQILLHKGLKVEVKIPLPDGRATFDTVIDGVCESPCYYLHLDYPVAINFEKLRSDVRVPIEEQVDVVAVTSLGQATRAFTGHVTDISVQGAYLLVEKELTNLVKSVKIGINLTYGDLKRDMQLHADIRMRRTLQKRDPNYPDCAFAYGIEFTQLSDADSLFLRLFSLEKIRNGSVRLCH